MDQPPEAGAAPAAAAADPGQIRCDRCGESVPALEFCIRCGDPLDDEHRKGPQGRVREGFAAAPNERATAFRIVSTIFPALPRESIRTFQLALLAGTILVVALGILGFFPIAIVAAAILVPLLTVLYVYDVDLYEDEPIRVVAVTFIWGAVTGALFAFTIHQLFPADAIGAVGGSVTGASTGVAFPFVRGILAPIVGGLIMIAGPLVLLSYPRFNDVLDGATFGVSSAVAFVGAQTLISATDQFSGGLQPVGDILPWVLRLLSLSVAMPLIAAGAIGGLGGVLWLRYRSPVRDRAALGPFGQPPVAVAVAAVLLIVAALAAELFDEFLQLVVLAALAAIAIVLLRRVIHLGLLQEAREIPIGDPITCPNCGKSTPSHTFCGHCGISLRALPKAGHAAPVAVAGGIVAPHRIAPKLPPGGPGAAAGAGVAAAGGRIEVAGPAAKGWLTERTLLIVFAVILLGAVAIAAGYAFTVTQGRDKPECPDKTLPCSGAGSGLALAIRASAPRSLVTADAADAPPFADRQTYTDDSLGFSFEYDSSIWEIAKQDAGFVLLSAFGGGIAMIIEGTPADQFTDQQIFEARRGLLDQALLGLAADTDPKRALLGSPILGHRAGVGGLFGGSLDSSQGPSVDMTAAEVAASDGQITLVATVLVPVEIRDIGLLIADSIAGSLIWPADTVVP